MSSIAKLFNEEMQSALNYSGVWLPNKLLTPGDICSFRDGQLQRISSLETLGVPVEIRELQHVDDVYWETPGSFDFEFGSDASGDSDKLEAEASGEATFHFKTDFAVVMELENIRGKELSDLKLLERDLVERYRQDDWDKSDFIVIETLIPSRSAIIVSTNRDASASLNLAASASTVKSSLPLNAKGSLALATSISNSKGVAFQSLTDTETTPLVRLARLVDPLFGKPKISMKSHSTDGLDAPFIQTGVDYTFDSN